MKILYTVAKDKNGLLIKAKDAEKGNDFFCPTCNTELILRKSGKSGKGARRPHYAHKALTPNCTPETALHYSFKNLFANKIEQHISALQPLQFTWDCKFCGLGHMGDLIKKAKFVKIEHNLKVCQPDIALLDENENVIAVVEIVVTHKPEEKVLKYYNDNNIILIQINLTSDKDIDELDKKIRKPNKVELCVNPRCKTCKNFQSKVILTIIDGPCWKCDNTMKIAVISASNGGDIRGVSNISPKDFTNEEIAFAESKGVILKKQFSKTVQESYMANSCANCGSFSGNFYLFTQYIIPASNGYYPSETFDIGFHCNNCEDIAYQSLHNPFY